MQISWRGGRQGVCPVSKNSLLCVASVFTSRTIHIEKYSYRCVQTDYEQIRTVHYLPLQ